jgi:molybdopterin synthase catalytic subunit
MIKRWPGTTINLHHGYLDLGRDFYLVVMMNDHREAAFACEMCGSYKEGRRKVWEESSNTEILPQ